MTSLCSLGPCFQQSTRRQSAAKFLVSLPCCTQAEAPKQAAGADCDSDDSPLPLPPCTFIHENTHFCTAVKVKKSELEKPAKIATKKGEKDGEGTSKLYGDWQTEPWVPEAAANGKVRRVLDVFVRSRVGSSSVKLSAQAQAKH